MTDHEKGGLRLTGADVNQVGQEFTAILGRMWGLFGWLVLVAVARVPVDAQAPAALVVTSTSLKANETIPADYTADGRNISPALQWSGAPTATKEFAVICDDPDAPMAQPFVHWVIYKIPGTAKGLPENVPIDPGIPMPAGIAGTVQGLNGFKRAMYRGPAPPAGKPHGYHFVVYALDAPLDLRPNLTRAELLEAIKGHVIGQGEIVPVYERK